MPLQYDRPNVTAAQLNAAWSDIIARLAPALPMTVRDPNGDGSSVFDDLDISEGEQYSFAIAQPIDLGNALLDRATDFGGATWLLTNEGTSVRVVARESYSLEAVELPGRFADVLLEPDGDTALTVTATRYFEAGTGWTTGDRIGRTETFDGTGFRKWNPGERTAIGATETFSGTGLLAWNPGVRTTIGQVEARWTGFEEGVSPVVPKDTECLSTENISDQANGVRTSFTVSESFESGTLRVYLNGQRLSDSVITETSSTTFTLSDPIAETEDEIVVDYCACAC